MAQKCCNEIRNIARVTQTSGSKTTFNEVANVLEHKYKLMGLRVGFACKMLEKLGWIADANRIARAFTTRDAIYVYPKK